MSQPAARKLSVLKGKSVFKKKKAKCVERKECVEWIAKCVE
jgi:hypothetical protein